MKIQTFIAGAVLPTLTFGFPGMMPGASKEDAKRHMEEKRDTHEDLEKRQLLSTLLSDVDGLLGSVAASVDPDNLRPQAGYTFQAPTASDSRGPCPGLNLLANYGYLPRNGYVTLSQVVEAAAEGFNMGTDLSTLLAVFAVLADGDIATESFYLGAGPGNVGGLNRHSTVEADVSPNREDYYNGCGDAHHLSSRMFTQNVQFAASGSKQFDLATMGDQYAANAQFSKTYNPYLYYFPFPLIVSLGAFVFYPNFFSNGTYGAGGVANYESISSIIGAQLNKTTGHYEYVPERWPENWYRRSTEYGAVDATVQLLADIYVKNPIIPAFGQIGTPNLNATTVLCDVYQGINSILPLAISGDAESSAAALTWALSVLDPYFSNTVLGCPTDTLSSDFLYPNATGGPLSPPPAVSANAGNNVYDKVYFTSAPTSTQCSHTYNS